MARHAWFEPVRSNRVSVARNPSGEGALTRMSWRLPIGIGEPFASSSQVAVNARSASGDKAVSTAIGTATIRKAALGFKESTPMFQDGSFSHEISTRVGQRAPWFDTVRRPSIASSSTTYHPHRLGLLGGGGKKWPIAIPFVPTSPGAPA